MVDIDFRLLAPPLLEAALKKIILRKNSNKPIKPTALQECTIMLKEALERGRAKLVFDSKNAYIDIVEK